MKACSRCGLTRDRNGRYCKTCHAAYMRHWRKSHPLNEEQRRKDNARSYLGVYVRRGDVLREPCEVCGLNPAEAHHDDYDRPLDVRWLCRPHHLALHKVLA